MEAYAQVLNFAIPIFIILIVIEWGIGFKMNIETNRIMDTISSLSSGITNSIKDVLGLSVIIISYTWLFDHFALIQINSKPWLYVVAFIGLDFAGYWSHRFSHVVNIFWNRHIIHHSSEEFNLACALRQSISEVFAIFTFLYIPMAVVGVPPAVIGIVAPLHLFAQFWYHTRLIGKMGFLEHIIVTPSHHRVHHAINPEYLDKNYSQIFIVWDKLFGSFQEELDHIRPVYGVSRPVKTWNPIIINFKHLWLLISDAFYTKSWWDKIRIWFMPTGWRPADVEEKYKIESVKDVYGLNKYDIPASSSLKIWITAQLLIHLFLMLFLFNNLSTIGNLYALLYGVFLFISVFAYTSLMDGSKYAFIPETLKFIFAIILLSYMDWNWFQLETWIPSGNTFIISYLVLSIILSYLFTLQKMPSYNFFVSSKNT
ncbi:MAG: sterol desaturase family protein [Saprospiraceae bacterium]|nr:sterol desaturase family protein [Saprospiraceae bacterium]